MAAAFFYGTLIHPAILTRVIGNNGSHLTIAPAILFEYTRHRVKHADYPAILPASKAQALFDHELSIDERSVRGILVIGLTQADIVLLDYFEGDEYQRVRVTAHPLFPFKPLEAVSSEEDISRLVPLHPPPLPPVNQLPPAFEVETYVWIQSPNTLEKKLWSFDQFVKDSAWKWHGKGSQTNPDILEVDQEREKMLKAVEVQAGQ